MPQEPSILDRIRANAALTVRIAHADLGVGLGYDEAGVKWLDGYLQRQHEAGDPALRDKLTSTLGSYLGECIVHSFGGAWAEIDGTWGIRFDDKNAVFPFAKVSKHLANGSEDSVLSFFTLIPLIYDNTSFRPTTSKDAS